MSNRLPLDAHLIGYWGFDEALETDAAIDGTNNALNLTVNASSGTSPGRVGNSRLFDGASSYASISSALLRLTGDLTLMGWAKLNSYNPSGTQLRALISCGGPTTGDNLLYGVAVTLSGQLTYRHTSAAGEVIVSTPPGTIKTNQFYFIAIRRIANGSNQDIEIYVDNVLKSTTVTVGGSPSSMPVPPPLSNPSAIFSVGRSQKEPDLALWHGAIDEISVHDVARPYHAYLIEAYYRASIRAETTKLTATNTVVAVSSYDMGAGVRWWCIERDKDLYVVKESPFGNFGPETRLTTVGGGNSSLTGSPELIYDATNDTLYVFFVSGNRIYKLTANSTDDPATINMPYTADTGNIIKSVDNVEGGRFGDSSVGQRNPLESDFVYVNRTPIKLSLAEAGDLGDSSIGGSYSVVQGTPNAPNIEIMTLPTQGLGLVIGPSDSETGGYTAYRLEGGAATALSAPILLPDYSNRYFVPLASRPYGRAYYAEALTVDGKPSGVFTPVIVDFFNETFEYPTGVIQYGRNGSGTDNGSFGDSSIGARDPLISDFSYVNRAPLKLSTQDPSVNLLGDSSTGQTAIVTQGSITVVAQ
jgi:hypothetical protein